MNPKRFIIFLALSLLLHLLLLLVVAFGWLRWFMAEPPPPPSTSVRIRMVEKPPVPPAPDVNRQRPFIDTADSVKAEAPNPDATFQGADNTVAMSRQPGPLDAPMPNLTGQNSDTLSLRNTPYTPQIENPPSPPSPRQEQEKRERSEVKPEPQDKPDRESEAPTRPALTKSQQGMLLTREEEEQRRRLLEEKRRELNESEQTLTRAAPMAFSAERRQSKLPGGGPRGEMDSFGAEQTEIGRYKQRLYRAIGSRWYVYIEQSQGLVSIGTVRIRFYVRSDGVFERIEVVSGDSGSQLYAVSRRSIMEVSGQMEPFSQLMMQQLGDGYWEEISFTIR